MHESGFLSVQYGKATSFLEIGCEYFFMVLCLGRSCKEVHGKILRTDEQNNSTATQSRNIMPWRPPVKKRRNGICWRIVFSLLTDCSEMPEFGSNWQTWYFMVSEQTCTSSHQMDQSLWQTLDSLDFLHSPHMWIQTILLCGNNTQQCRLGLFQDSDFAGDFEDSKSTSGGLLCIFGSQTFVPISWMCKKETSVSHRSREAELFSLDAGLRMDGVPALDLWYLVIEVFHSSSNQINKSEGQESQGNLSRNTTLHMKNQNPTKHVNLDLNNVDHVLSNVRSSRFGAMLHVFEVNEVVIKMIIKRSKLHNETRVKNPQSCSGLVVWQD